MDEVEEKILKSSIAYAESKGFSINPDQKMITAVISGLARNQKEKGQTYCPCRAVTGDKEEDKKIIYPCIYYLDEIKQDGYCKCRLFFGARQNHHISDIYKE